MKNIKFILFTAILALATVSCDTYDEFSDLDVADRELSVGFTKATQNVSVNGTRDQSLQVFVSEFASVERTYNVVVVAEGSEVAPENYTFDSAVTIPANEKIGEFVISFTDVSLQPEGQPLIVAIEESSEYFSAGKTTMTVKN